MITVHDQPQCNLLINLIEQGSEHLRAGMDAVLLKYKWRTQHGDDAVLAGGLQQLVDEGWITVHPGDDMMLRLTARAYDALCSAADQSPRLAPDDPAWSDDESATPTSGGGGQRSELAMRQQLLGVYHDLGISAEGHLTAATAQRIWADSAQRDEELRLAVDLGVRDGYLRLARPRGGAQFILTDDGARYAAGRKAPDVLLRSAPPADPSDTGLRTLSDEAWQLLGAVRLSELEITGAFDLAAVANALASDALPRFAAAHVCELLHRYGWVDATIADDAVSFAWSEQGVAFRAQACSDDNRKRLRDALRLAERRDDEPARRRP